MVGDSAVRLSALVCGGAIVSGCFLTPGVTEDIRTYRHPKREFRETDGAHTPIHVGGFLGEVTRNGVTYDRYQFPDVLERTSGHQLEILIADTVPPSVSIRENMIGSSGGPVARLFVNKSLLLIDPEQLDSHAIRLLFKAESNEVSRYIGHDEANRPKWQHATADVDLQWRERSRTTYVLHHLRYLYAVPVDLLAMPFVAAWWLYRQALAGP